MNYTIFSIDDRRKHYTDDIRAQLSKSFWFNEVKTDVVDGRNEEELRRQIHKHRFYYPAGIKVGQLGIWFTVVNALRSLDDEHFVTFEDDAILHPSFEDMFWLLTNKLPRDTDAFALFLPRDQDHAYDRNMLVNGGGSLICRAYQRYGGVSMMWTPQGADKFLSLVRSDGITDQWDDQLFKYAKQGKMNVYTTPPTAPALVEISGWEESIVQESEVFE